jgi:hypothetical protein
LAKNVKVRDYEKSRLVIKVCKNNIVRLIKLLEYKDGPFIQHHHWIEVA